MSQTETKPATIPPFVNKSMKAVLSSPLHALVSKSILLISFNGLKTGRVYTTPVSYSRFDDCVYIFTHANWWKNLTGGQPVTLKIRGQLVRGLPEIVSQDKLTIAVHLAQHLRVVRSDAKFYGVTFDNQGKPDMQQLQQAVRTVVMIRVRLIGSSN